jgi:putative DNA methylase
MVGSATGCRGPSRIFAQMVDDPSEYVDTLLCVTETRRAAEGELKKRRALWGAQKTAFEAATEREKGAVNEAGPEPTLRECATDIERLRLFRIVEDLVKWENTTNEVVLERAQAEIWQSWRRACADNAGDPLAKTLFDRRKLPAFHDPFAGSGALPLEAQRLGLEAFASDLNPVAVLINKAMIEVPPKFAGTPPVNPARDLHKHWKGAQGLAEDLRYYGQWMRDEAEKRIGHLYPKVEITAEMATERSDFKPLVGRKLTVIAWLWARTVKSPNPAFRQVDVPLASTFMLSTKVGHEVYVEPIIEDREYRFVVRVGKPKDAEAARVGTKPSRGSNFRCLMTGTPIDGDYIKREGQAQRIGTRLMAMVADGGQRRIYLSPTVEHEAIAQQAKPEWRPQGDVPARLTGGTCVPYGLSTWGDLFTVRQLAALNTFCDLASDVRDQVRSDASTTAFSQDNRPLRDGGIGLSAYVDAISLYLSLAISRCADYGSSICTWRPKDNAMRSSMPKQAVQMAWDFAEGSPLPTPAPDSASV